MTEAKEPENNRGVTLEPTLLQQAWGKYHRLEGWVNPGQKGGRQTYQEGSRGSVTQYLGRKLAVSAAGDITT